MRALPLCATLLLLLSPPVSLRAQTLEFVEAIDNEALGFVGFDDPYDVVVSPDGAHLYAVTGFSGAAAIHVLSIDSAGSIAHVQAVSSNLVSSQRPPSVAISPDGQWVFFSGRGSTTPENLSIWRRDAATGELTFVERLLAGTGPFDFSGSAGVVVGVNSRFVYVVGDGVVVLEIAAGTGFLSLVQALPVNGVLDSAAISPDGTHLYLADTSVPEAIVVLLISPITGEVAIIDAAIEGENGVLGLGAATDMAFSPDGRNLHVSVEERDALVVFSRGPADGALSYVETKFDLLQGVSGLDRASATTVSPSGDMVVVTGIADASLAYFRRNGATGSLEFLGSAFEGVDGVDGLNNPQAVVFNPAGTHLYTVGPIFGGFDQRQGIMSHFRTGIVFADGFE